MMRITASLRWFLWNIARLLSYTLFRRSFEQAITDWFPDVIHAHDTMALPAAANAAQRSGARLIFDSHELETHRNPPQLWINRAQTRRIEARYLPQADHVITVGHKIAEHLAQEYAIARPSVIFNSPQLEPSPLPARWQQAPRTDVRQETGLPPETPLLVYTGNVAMNRGIEQTIEGLAQYHLDHPGAPAVHLSTVGRAPDAAQRALTSLASRLDLAERLHFHDPVAANDVTRFIATATAAVIPIIPQTLSYEYAMPNKLFEAALAGLPILGADLAEMGPFIRDNGLGQTYDSRAAAAFSQGLHAVLAQPRSTGASHPEAYSWETQSKQLLEIYQDICD